MAGPQRKQRKPTISKPVGTEFKSISELKSDAEKSLRTNKMKHYTPKKRVILLPGPAPENAKKEEPKEKE